MDYNLQIKLTAINAASAQINSVSAAVNKLDGATKRADKSSSNFGKKLESTGSRINVMGQRLTWMVSAPLLLFANKSIQTAVDIETSWVRFRKVFNGTEEDIKSLQKIAVELSNKFGRPVEEISNIMAEFNKAGIDSVSELEKLASVVSQTAIIFDVDMKTALDGTKAVMKGFNLTAGDTEKALAAINIIADKTTGSEKGILEVFNRAAGTARQAGFSFKELAASQSVFEKNAIPAGRAGNAMKSILVSLTKQSNKAKDEFNDFGINMDSTAWRTAGAGEKLNILARKLDKVKSSKDKLKIADFNKALATLAGKYQVNNLNVLLEDLSYEFDNNADTISQFYEGLRVSSDETENLKFQNQQLQKVLESSPMKLDIMNQMYRNQQAIIGNELLPVKLELLKIVTSLLEKFNKSSDETKKWVLIIGGLLVVAGPLLSIVGLITTAVGFTASAFGWMAGTSLAAKLGMAKLSGGSVLLAAAVTALTIFAIKKATEEFVALEEQLRINEEWIDKNKVTLDELQKSVGKLSTDNANKNLQNAIDKSREADKALADLDARYKGLGGKLKAVGDQFYSWGERAVNAIEKVYKKWRDKKEASGGSVDLGGEWNHKADGGIVYAANGFLSKGRDTIPAMLSPGEMVLNKSQQSTMFDMLSGRVQGERAGGVVVNISVGNMIASRGEQREFARKITELINENDNRR